MVIRAIVLRATWLLGADRSIAYSRTCLLIQVSNSHTMTRPAKPSYTSFTLFRRHSHEAHHPSRRSCGSCKCGEFYSAYGCVVCECRQVGADRDRSFLSAAWLGRLGCCVSVADPEQTSKQLPFTSFVDNAPLPPSNTLRRSGRPPNASGDRPGEGRR